MGLLSSYLMRSILASTVMVMFVLLALAGLFEFIGQLEDTQEITVYPRRSCSQRSDCPSLHLK